MAGTESGFHRSRETSKTDCCSNAEHIKAADLKLTGSGKVTESFPKQQKEVSGGIIPRRREKKLIAF